MDISILRTQIDAIDDALISLIKKRLRAVEAIAEIKKHENKPIKDEKREKEIMTRLKKLAKELKIDQKVIEDIYKILINESTKIQKKHMKKK